MPVQGLAHHRPDGEIGHVVIVHDIEMDEIGAGMQHGIDFLAQAGEVGGQDGGGDPAGFHRLKSTSIKYRGVRAPVPRPR